MGEHESAVITHVLQRLREIVRSRGMSGAELVRRSGIARGTLYAALREGETQNLTLDQVWALARGLDLSPADLLPLDHRPGPSFNPVETELVEAIQALDVGGIRGALTRLLPGEIYDRVVGGVVMPYDERRQLAEAMKAASAELGRLAELASKSSQPGPSTDE